MSSWLNWYWQESSYTPTSRILSEEDREVIRNFKPLIWQSIMKRAQRFMMTHDMSPIEYAHRLGADPEYILGLFDHRLRPYYDEEKMVKYNRTPDMTKKFTYNDQFFADSAKYLYADLEDEKLIEELRSRYAN